MQPIAFCTRCRGMRVGWNGRYILHRLRCKTWIPTSSKLLILTVVLSIFVLRFPTPSAFLLSVADSAGPGVQQASFQVPTILAPVLPAVDPLVHTIDPLFLGLHDITGSEMSSKTIPKAAPLEKVGNFVLADAVLQVIEYSDLPEELAKQTTSDGGLRFNAGSIAIHALRVSFIERLNAGGDLKLPWHRAEKKVPFVIATGGHVDPPPPEFDDAPIIEKPYTVDRVTPAIEAAFAL